MKAAIARQVAVVHKNHTDGCLPSHNFTADSSPASWRNAGTGAPAPDQCRQRRPGLMPHLPRTPPASPGRNEGAYGSQIEGVPPGYVYILTPLPSNEFVNLDAYAKNSKHDKDFIPDLLPDEEASTR